MDSLHEIDVENYCGFVKSQGLTDDDNILAIGKALRHSLVITRSRALETYKHSLSDSESGADCGV
jgi:hypothetical protein